MYIQLNYIGQAFLNHFVYPWRISKYLGTFFFFLLFFFFNNFVFFLIIINNISYILLFKLKIDKPILKIEESFEEFCAIKKGNYN